MRSSSKLLPVLTLLLVLAAGTLYAQSGTATITGPVGDQAGAALSA